MNAKRSTATDAAGVNDAIVSAVRTSLGDTVRSVIYFTPSAFDVLYVRQDLYGSSDEIHEAKSQLVEFERVGFAEGPIRTAIAQREGGSDIGPYHFTIRVHDRGFVVRVIVDDAGVLFTADAMDIAAFEDAAAAIVRLLHDASD